MENRLSPLSPLAPQKWTPVEIEDLQVIKEKEGSIPGFMLRRLVWEVHYKLGHIGKEAEVRELKRYPVDVKVPRLLEILEKLHNACLQCHRKPSIVRKPFDKNLHSLTVNESNHTSRLSQDEGFIFARSGRRYI